MKQEERERVMARNPNVDRSEFERVQEIVEKLRDAGVKSNSLSATPPVDPYSVRSSGIKGKLFKSNRK